MVAALNRHNDGLGGVNPDILRPGVYDGLPFSALQSLPSNGIPIRDRKWHTRDEAFSNVAQGIRQVVNELLCKLLLEEAEIYLYREQYETALEMYEKAISLDPDNPLTYVGEGNSRLKLASAPLFVRPCYNYEKALQAFKKAITLDASIAQAYAGKGRALFGLYTNVSKIDASKSEIENAYGKAIELDPQTDIFYM